MSAVPEAGATQPIEAVASIPHELEDVQMGDDTVSQPAAPATAIVSVPESTEAMDTSTGPSITSALEAMLDNFDPMPALEEFPTVKSENQGSEWIPAPPTHSAEASTHINTENHDATKPESNEASVPVVESEDNDSSVPVKTNDDLEMSDNVDTKPAENHDTEPTAPDAQQEDANEDDHPEWEVDSSPYESSSDSSSDSDSDSDDSEDEKYELLGIEETARILMKAEGESDDEGDSSGKAGKQMRTKNEVDEQYAPRPDVVITEQMKIEPVGVVEHIVENTAVVKGFTPAEYQVLDSGSILCLGDRTVVGTIAEPLGKVQQPMYLVGFQTVAEMAELGLEAGTKLYYSVAHANYVFTSALKNLKGSDASNIHDEEVAADEVEFSDDEKEAEYKRMKKQKRREKNGKLPATGDAPRSGLRNEVKRDESSSSLNYDDKPKASASGGLNYDDGSYRRLTRPPGFGTGQAQPNYNDRQNEEPKYRETGHSSGGYHSGNSGRGRGGRGGGRGGYTARGGRGGNFSHNDSRSAHSSWDDNNGGNNSHNNNHNNSNTHNYSQQAHSQSYQPQPQTQTQPQYTPQYQPQPAQQMPQPTASGSYYAPQPKPSNVPAVPQQPLSPFGNGGSFLPFPVPPPPNANPASIPPLPQFNVAAAAAALVNGQIPMIPGLVLPQQAQPQHQHQQPQHQHQHQQPQHQHQHQYQHQYQHQHQPVPQQQQQPVLNPAQGQQQPQMNQTLAAAMANPAFMSFLAQASSALARNQSRDQGGHQ